MGECALGAWRLGMMNDEKLFGFRTVLREPLEGARNVG